ALGPHQVRAIVLVQSECGQCWFFLELLQRHGGGFCAATVQAGDEDHLLGGHVEGGQLRVAEGVQGQARYGTCPPGTGAGPAGERGAGGGGAVHHVHGPVLGGPVSHHGCAVGAVLDPSPESGDQVALVLGHEDVGDHLGHLGFGALGVRAVHQVDPAVAAVVDRDGEPVLG